MNVGDLLSELREGILHDFSDQIAGSDDRLWSDDRLMRYMNEAQRRFARKSMVIRDGKTPDVVQVPLVAGQTTYTLHKSVLAVLSATYGTDQSDLARTGHAVFGYQRTVSDLNLYDTSWPSTPPPGKPMVFSTDETVDRDDDGSMSVVTMRVFPAPRADFLGPINLRVARLPLCSLSLDALDAYPELPEDHHLEMLDWAAYLALRIVDLDEEAPNRANEFRASFEDHVKRARDEMMRKTFAPMGWAFGRRGFVWSGN